jgi:putative membrane protein
MSSGTKKFLSSWVINTLAVLVAAKVIKGIQYERNLDLIVASLLLGILNAVLRPILMFLALPLLIVTLGLFTLVINALLLYFVGYVLRPHFYVDGWWAAFWGALLISLISLILNTMTGSGDSRLRFERKSSRKPSDDDSEGPIIDV